MALTGRFGGPLPLFSLCGLLVVGGCGYGVNGATPVASAIVAPTILQQPANQSVPMGLSATYSVITSGTTPQYRWTKNGVTLPGATGSSYVTAPTTFADANSSFSVTVSNAAGTVTSVAAALTVTARAPSSGDLRFQQVDAASTVNGYGTDGSLLTTTLSGRTAIDYVSSLGSPFWVGATDICSAPTGASDFDCSWEYAATPLATAPGSALVAGYASDAYSNLQYDLADPNWPNIGGGISPAAFTAVATSLDLEPASQLFAVSWIQAPNTPSEFTLVQGAVPPAELQAVATQEGIASRVITAVSYDGGNAYYLSYGWSADPGTVYEAQVSTSPAASAPTAAAALAAQGYILTAIGRADAGGDVLFVGTRVQGATMPRPFMTAQRANLQTMMQQGYAVTGVIAGAGAGDAATYLGER